MLEFYFRFRLLRLRHHWHAILHLPAKFRQNRAIGDRVMTSYPFSKWRPRHRNSASGFVYVIPLIWKGRNLAADQISARNFNARLRYYYLRFFETKIRHVGILLPFRLLRLLHHRHVILHLLTNFRPNRIIRDRLITSCPFLRWWPRHRNSTSGFDFRESHSWRPKSICIPKFGKISQFTAEILLLLIFENKRPPYWNSTSGSDFYVCVFIGMSFCVCLPNFVQIGPSATELWRHIHFSRCGHGIAILLPVSIFVTLLIWEDRKLPAYQISARYLNPRLRLRYYYFRLLKTNVHHVSILLPVPIFTFVSLSACHSGSAYQISFKLDHRQQSYDVISTFKMAAVSHI